MSELAQNKSVARSQERGEVHPPSTFPGMKSGTEVTFLIEFAKIIIASKGPGGYYLGAENYMCKGLAKQQGLNPPPTPPSPSTRSLHVRLQAYSLLSLAYMGGGRIMQRTSFVLIRCVIVHGNTSSLIVLWALTASAVSVEPCSNLKILWCPETDLLLSEPRDNTDHWPF